MAMWLDQIIIIAHSDYMKEQHENESNVCISWNQVT